ncbi:endochitinase 1 precursor [Tricladium varicosporioides]|nr:endochitinase 1 precursor [Hymenoscyphus varicosporioides]
MDNDTYRSVVYYVNWATHRRNFPPQHLPADQLTHVLYAFANINPSTGQVYLSNSSVDTDFRFNGDSWTEPGKNLYGCLKQLYLLKKQHRNLKVLLSIGGSTYSSNFARPASAPLSWSIFASSIITLITNLGLDGIDINWEYPSDDSQASDFVLLLQAVREALDAYGNSLEKKHHFELSVASPAGPSNYQRLHLKAMYKYVDFWNLMAYDYAGSWSSVTAHQANLFPSDDPASSPFNTKTAIDYYTSQGILDSKIVVDGLGKPFSGVALPLPGATEFCGISCISYSYDSKKRELISYDNVEMARVKAAWIFLMDLGGVMWWESSADKVGNNSLIRNVVDLLRGKGGVPENSPNQLLYTNSSYDNLRAGMPGSDSAVLTSNRHANNFEQFGNPTNFNYSVCCFIGINLWNFYYSID